MRVIIAGAGAVGTHLARMLSNEDQDITLIDRDEKRLHFAGFSTDILTIKGDPTSILTLQDSGIESADLFVSVLNESASNILACILAMRLGAKKCIARIDNQEYMQSHYAKFFKDMGIDMFIFPELLAADEIVSSIKNPWARQYIDLFDGALALVGVKIRRGAPLVGKQLKDLSINTEKTFHIVAIKRDMETIIPSGSTQVMHGDILFYTCSKSHLSLVRHLSGKDKRDANKVIIMGASQISVLTANKLPHSMQVCIIDQDPQRCIQVAAMVPANVQIFNGDGRDPELLREVGIDTTDVFIALTGNSETNILACLGAKRYGVFKTIAKEENIDYIPLAERMDIGTLINKKLIAAGHIHRMLLGVDTESVKCLTIANADVAELIARKDSKITRKRVRDLDLPDGMTLGGMVRGGVPSMIDGNTIIQPYDHVVVFCLGTSMNKLAELFR
ncbi:Trk system potassium uptake protein TrkA [Porphyromonas crevioricanis JCM 15906]|uniref:Trk system potassium uptake protein TrkA n=1 Tax=Porphyromonas crevioricanis JCM 15906 TaxID=1305617 RepID=T1DT03_9PORP|nr:Trk system potassium transporter TrkA [Porphyromonas crevioricanis]GAD05524.1 Trk system potassium uptake protein TrkA [Porphyromonas crevioricanis JCM 15906]SJZ93358.1 trk system potassium uptake protein TrkA [Porphyromonas crevioricanis]